MARERGFTLMELLVSLALVATMTVLLYGALQQGSRVWHRGTTAAERESRMMLVWRRLRDLFFLAGIPALRSKGRTAPFRGDTEGLEFITSMGWNTGAGLYLVKLEQRGEGERHRLVLRRWLLHPEVIAGQTALPDPNAPASTRAGARFQDRRNHSGLWYAEAVLATHVRRVRFDYLAKGSAAEWQKKWTLPNALPSRVRLEVEDDRGAWPEMIFELPAS